MFFRIPDRELLEIKKSIADIHDLLRETREQYISEIGLFRASHEMSVENQRNLQALKEDVTDLRSTVKECNNYIKEQESIKKNRHDILRQNLYALFFKGIVSISVILSGLTALGMMHRLSEYIGQQQQQIKLLDDKIK